MIEGNTYCPSGGIPTHDSGAAPKVA